MKGSGENQENGGKTQERVGKKKPNNKNKTRKTQKPHAEVRRGRASCTRRKRNQSFRVSWVMWQQFTEQLKVSNLFSNPSSESNAVGMQNRLFLS